MFFGGGTNACTGTMVLGGETFMAGLLDIRTQLASELNFGEIIFSGTGHTAIQSAAFYLQSSGGPRAAGGDGGGSIDGGRGISMTDWVADLLTGNATNAVPGCTSETCADFPAGTCGVQGDTCGGRTVACNVNDAGGLCPSGQFCGGGGPSLCGTGGDGAITCVPKACADFPFGTCGVQSDGCGGVTDACGANDAGSLCLNGWFCGAGGAQPLRRPVEKRSAPESVQDVPCVHVRRTDTMTASISATRPPARVRKRSTFIWNVPSAYP